MLLTTSAFGALKCFIVFSWTLPITASAHKASDMRNTPINYTQIDQLNAACHNALHCITNFCPTISSATSKAKQQSI